MRTLARANDVLTAVQVDEVQPLDHDGAGAVMRLAARRTTGRTGRAGPIGLTRLSPRPGR